MTEDEARAKRCHLTMSDWYRRTPAGTPLNDLHVGVTRCIASDCMAWRTVSVSDGYCGLAGEPARQPPDLPDKPEATEPPANLKTPVIWQEEQRMRCTTGEWSNSPTDYQYQWVQDGTLEIGPDNDTLPLLASNDGHSITCLVTAINAAGETVAPPSNALVYHAPAAATSAMLISGDFSDTEWSNMIATVGGNASAWQGFDVVVDGINLTLRAQFPGIVTADDICAVINAALGTYLTAETSTVPPWQFLIYSNTTGHGSTIGYAAAPSHITDDEPEPNKQTTDLSLTMRLRQSVGAITVQGIDATGGTRQ